MINRIMASGNTFPSPYGLIFILTGIKMKLLNVSNHKFPSPYGVIFILIEYNYSY